MGYSQVSRIEVASACKLSLLSFRAGSSSLLLKELDVREVRAKYFLGIIVGSCDPKARAPK